MIYIKLFLSFFKIGLFSFGGGYAMIPLIEKEIEGNSWLSPSEFVDIIAIAEMTPGPIAVNSATFVGYKVTGFFGGIVATMGVAMPSLILAIFISKLFFKYQEHPLNTSIFYGIRPVIAALIMSAAIFVGKTCILSKEISLEFSKLLTGGMISVIDIPSLFILIIMLIALIKYKVHPIIGILGSGVLGIIIFSIV